ncbi:RelA/SpoT domain-containing protein [Bradyrhizobium sediminis]|uniref:RelA/SpoT domain-containing protein n=1 Tax=Bradyrhizobium sediminis TaxID=2840469 RepID=A0A975NSK5_9BRAD|nr:RelA/SpoT domain-containing protein [Bradyrhizobium sediminis]QWG19911.1 RelA/SpoT domain-containing protein [Bradyrhizobium sediminis]
MVWATPEYPKRWVNDAGSVIADYSSGSFDDHLAYLDALDIVNNWRSSHNFPLNTFHVGLKRRGKLIDRGIITAQRIKRLSSIEAKLSRFKTMTLSQMQDIGGCRAIMRSAASVKQLCEAYASSEIKHELAANDDYIASPKESGYRGTHLVYKYFSDRKTDYNTLKIEIQIRSQLQHAWATAVETVGTLQQQALKSSQGERDWLRFFALASSAFAFREGTAPVPGTPVRYRDLIAELRDFARSLDLEKRLQAYGHAMRFLSNPQHGRSDNHYFLLEMNPAQMSIQVTTFKFSESTIANQKYLEVEKKLKNTAGAEAVLVSVDSLDAVRKAYPNYFLDTGVFVQLIRDTTKRLSRPKLIQRSPNQLQLDLF